MLRIAGLQGADPVASLSELALAELTYPEVGATALDSLPSGYRHLRQTITLGSGPQVWDRARCALTTWVPQRGAGASVHPTGAPRTGGEVLVTLTAGRVAVLAPCRVVATFDEPDRFGFAYGTLPGVERHVR